MASVVRGFEADGLGGVMLVSDDEVIAIHRAKDEDGRDGAMIELRRRWVGLSDRTTPDVLDRILAMSVHVPTPEPTVVQLRAPRHDGTVAARNSKQW